MDLCAATRLRSLLLLTIERLRLFSTALAGMSIDLCGLLYASGFTRSKSSVKGAVFVLNSASACMFVNGIDWTSMLLPGISPLVMTGSFWPVYPITLPELPVFFRPCDCWLDLGSGYVEVMGVEISDR